MMTYRCGSQRLRAAARARAARAALLLLAPDAIVPHAQPVHVQVAALLQWEVDVRRVLDSTKVVAALPPSANVRDAHVARGDEARQTMRDASLAKLMELGAEGHGCQSILPSSGAPPRRVIGFCALRAKPHADDTGGDDDGHRPAIPMINFAEHALSTDRMKRAGWGEGRPQQALEMLIASVNALSVLDWDAQSPATRGAAPRLYGGGPVYGVTETSRMGAHQACVGWCPCVRTRRMTTRSARVYLPPTRRHFADLPHRTRRAGRLMCPRTTSLMSRPGCASGAWPSLRPRLSRRSRCQVRATATGATCCTGKAGRSRRCEPHSYTSGCTTRGSAPRCCEPADCASLPVCPASDDPPAQCHP